GGPGAARAGAAPGGRAVERCGGGWLCCERPESGSASTGSARASCDEASSSDASTHRPESAEPRRRQLALEFNSIGAQLNMLEEEEDLGRVLVARRCHSLGFESEQLLMNHCSQFGRVSRVLVIGQGLEKTARACAVGTVGSARRAANSGPLASARHANHVSVPKASTCRASPSLRARGAMSDTLSAAATR
ncbi:unnamed protein product, partial [Prorocentrum cordatum]